MIPKVIHYCWFGGGKKTKLMKQCIKSWKKLCPDYEIKEWNESNFDINACKYVSDAYKMKKWAFVADFARLWIIYNNGGIYLDTDVEIIKPLDALLDNEAYFGFEDDKLINTGLGFGAVKGNAVVEKLLEDYYSLDFLDEDGKPNNIPCTYFNTKSIEAELAGFDKTKIFRIDGATFYPKEYFNPKNFVTEECVIHDETYSIHHYTMSWLTRSFPEKVKRVIKKVVGKKNYQRLKRLKEKLNGDK